MDKPFRLWAGIDWGSEKHAVCVIDAQEKVVLQRSVEHTGEDIQKLAEQLLGLADGDPDALAVALELPRGAILETLIERQVAVFSINPKQLDRFRDRYTMAGAKDDRRDAFVLAASLRTDTPRFRRVQLGEPALVRLRELSRMHEELTKEVNALGNRLREQLHRYFPQVLGLGSVYSERWLWDLLEMAPTPAQAQSLRPSDVLAILTRHRIRRLDAGKVVDILGQTPLRVAPGVTEACAEHIQMLLPRLRLVASQREQCEQRLKTLLEELSRPLHTSDASDEGTTEPRDARILLSLPGVGVLVGATMLAEATQMLQERDRSSLRAQCGIAPVTRQSGKSMRVLMRRACNPRLRQAVYHWARVSIRYEPRSREHYAALRAKGQSLGRALRGVADRLLTMLLSMLATRTLYDARRRAPPPRMQLA
ncbi:IS110 family transposase [Polyangium aurulentum]|uniref:IS110 family transposase n=1 Tax=Polyangium aurulentum TaxID=2567896 RepID=UPI00200DC8CF|nr:IS110 family transposase [Polyangium aurulentum]UQA59961.1 IS110 family transposase [Polyangium aurulentum]UQA63211.1 IS110 family transposase [Polyangium aurulentum]